MNNITLTMQLSDEDRARLDKILELLSSLGPTAPTPESPSAAPTVEEPADAPELEQEEEQEEEINPAELRKEVQAMVINLSAAGHKDRVRGIVRAYAERVSLIPDNKLKTVIAELEKIR